ncbi:hypothetical protein DFH07DRAFT_764840 [Mycena maculata]|uniref:Uncharacterized protein n=1 Tax=Mycena maculata TaxID=230809 RepID=A0AAD7NZH9_9AGAR|nr:hypothetical protein DFH07DRAFT_764840 [Mycena maculata]
MKGKTHGHEEHASAVIDIKSGRSTTWKFPAEILGSTAEELADRSGSSLRTEATIRGPRHRDGKEMEASCLAPREVRHGLCWQILSRDNTTVNDFLGTNNVYRGSSREYTMTRQPKKCAEMWTGIMESLSGQNGTTPATVDLTKISVKKREDGQFAQKMLPGEDHRIEVYVGIGYTTPGNMSIAGYNVEGFKDAMSNIQEQSGRDTQYCSIQ